MPRHRLIIGHRAPSEGRKQTASFVHQKISRGKVPVVAVDAGDRNVNRSLRDAGEAKRKRMHPWHDGEGRGERRESLQKAFWAGDAGVGERGPGVAAMAAPLRVAPLWADAMKNSSVTGAYRQAAIGRPVSTNAAETAQSGRPAR